MISYFPSLFLSWHQLVDGSQWHPNDYALRDSLVTLTQTTSPTSPNRSLRSLPWSGRHIESITMRPSAPSYVFLSFQINWFANPSSYSHFHRKVNNVPYYQRLYQDPHSHAPIWLKVSNSHIPFACSHCKRTLCGVFLMDVWMDDWCLEPPIKVSSLSLLRTSRIHSHRCVLGTE